jgi:O-antigen/teichoic acid export membrane protein
MRDLLKRQYISLISDTRFSEILTGSAWALGARVAATGLTLVTSIIAARFYGADIVGVVAMISSFLGLATIFTVMGTNTSILRLIPEHMAKHSPSSAFRIYKKTQNFIAALSVFTGAIVFFSADLIAGEIFSKPHLSPLFQMSAFFIVFLTIMSLNTQAVRGLRLIRPFAFMQLLPATSRLLTLLFTTLFLFHPYNPVYALFASYAITACIGILIMQVRFQELVKPDDEVNPIPIKTLASISFPMLMTATMTFVIGQTGILMLGMFRSEAEVGYYAVAVRMATLTTFVLGAINSMAAPKFSELFHTGKMDELFYVARKSAKLVFWTTTPILICLVLLGKPILSLLFGSDFIAAYGPMVLLVTGQFINSISGSTGHFMNMTGNHAVFRNIILAASIMTVGLSFILIPPFGTIGAAFAGMVSLSLWNIWSLLYIKMRYGMTIGYVPSVKIGTVAAKK